MRVTYSTDDDEGGDILITYMTGEGTSYRTAHGPMVIGAGSASVTVSPHPENTLEERPEGLFAAPKLTSAQW